MDKGDLLIRVTLFQKDLLRLIILEILINSIQKLSELKWIVVYLLNKFLGEM